MSLKAIKDIYLYSTLNEASKKARDFLKGIDFKENFYGDEGQHPEVFTALKTWWKDGSFDHANDFPFIVYDSVYSDGGVIRSFIYGVEAILKSNIKELAALK